MKKIILTETQAKKLKPRLLNEVESIDFEELIRDASSGDELHVRLKNGKKIELDIKYAFGNEIVIEHSNTHYTVYSNSLDIENDKLRLINRDEGTAVTIPNVKTVFLNLTSASKEDHNVKMTHTSVEPQQYDKKGEEEEKSEVKKEKQAEFEEELSKLEEGSVLKITTGQVTDEGTWDDDTVTELQFVVEHALQNNRFDMALDSMTGQHSEKYSKLKEKDSIVIGAGSFSMESGSDTFKLTLKVSTGGEQQNDYPITNVLDVEAGGKKEEKGKKKGKSKEEIKKELLQDPEFRKAYMKGIIPAEKISSKLGGKKGGKDKKKSSSINEKIKSYNNVEFKFLSDEITYKDALEFNYGKEYNGKVSKSAESVRRTAKNGRVVAKMKLKKELSEDTYLVDIVFFSKGGDESDKEIYKNQKIKILDYDIDR